MKEKRYKKSLHFIVASIFCCSFSLQAGGLVQPNQSLLNDLSWLSNRGLIDISLSTWPLSNEEISASLDNSDLFNTEEKLVVQRVLSYINRQKNNINVQAFASSNTQKLPSDFAKANYSRYSLSAQANLSDDVWEVNLRTNVEDKQLVSAPSRYTLEGSHAGIKIYNQWLSFGQIARFWGPWHETSLIMSDAARPVTGFNLQRANNAVFETPWLSWIGKWQYQVFAGQLSQYQSVPHAKLIGARLTLMPTDFFELGLSRTMQWGGENRPTSFSSFWDAVRGHDNTGTDDEPGNQLGGFEARLKLYPLIELPLTIYGQLIGEDEAGMLPSRNFYLVGMEGSHQWQQKQVNWYIEGLSTRNSGNKKGYVYTHHIYKNGYYQQGFPLGASIGGDGNMIATKLELVEDNNRYSARLVYAKVNPNNQSINKAFPNADTLYGTELGWKTTLVNDQLMLEPKLWYVHSKNDSDHHIGVNLTAE